MLELSGVLAYCIAFVSSVNRPSVRRRLRRHRGAVPGPVDRRDLRAAVALAELWGQVHDDAVLLGVERPEAVARADAALPAPPRCARPRRYPRMLTRGTVSWWDRDEGWGALSSADVPGELFVHHSMIDGDERARDLCAGETVDFEWEACAPGRDGLVYRATHVRRRFDERSF
jgi:CspA family cold shock protein